MMVEKICFNKVVKMRLKIGKRIDKML